MESKIWMEIDPKRPQTMQEDWPGEFALFSSLEPRLGIPELLCLITTRKEGGKANACLHKGSTFFGDPDNYYILLTGLYKKGHTYTNLAREGEFCINYLRPEYLEACKATIKHNGDLEDELAAAGLTALPGKTVGAPRVGEAFLCLECKVADLTELSHHLVATGRIAHAAKEAGKGGAKDFVAYQYAARDPQNGADRENNIITLDFLRLL